MVLLLRPRLIPLSVNILEATEFPSQSMAQVDQRGIRKQQINDSCLGYWVRLLCDRKLPNKNDMHTRAGLTMFKQFDSLKLVRGMLKNTFCPGRGCNWDLLRGSQTLYRVAIKAALYRKAVQVCRPNITTDRRQAKQCCF